MEETTYPEPISSGAGLHKAFGVEEDELFTGRRFHPDEELLVFAKGWFCSGVGDDKDAVGL